MALAHLKPRLPSPPIGPSHIEPPPAPDSAPMAARDLQRPFLPGARAIGPLRRGLRLFYPQSTQRPMLQLSNVAMLRFNSHQI